MDQNLLLLLCSCGRSSGARAAIWLSAVPCRVVLKSSPGQVVPLPCPLSPYSSISQELILVQPWELPGMGTPDCLSVCLTGWLARVLI
jgi:hypothetical protein